jgi:hypothetical protein
MIEVESVMNRKPRKNGSFKVPPLSPEKAARLSPERRRLSELARKAAEAAPGPKLNLEGLLKEARRARYGDNE